MTSKPQLFNIDDFSTYGELAGLLVDEFNALILEEVKKESEDKINIMREDMLNNPELYASDSLITEISNTKS